MISYLENCIGVVEKVTDCYLILFESLRYACGYILNNLSERQVEAFVNKNLTRK